MAQMTMTPEAKRAMMSRNTTKKVAAAATGDDDLDIEPNKLLRGKKIKKKRKDINRLKRRKKFFGV